MIPRLALLVSILCASYAVSSGFVPIAPRAWSKTADVATCTIGWGTKGGDEDSARDASEGVKTRKRKARTKSTEPSFWHDENDPFVVGANERVHATTAVDDGSVSTQDIERRRKGIQFTIRGNPRVLIRHRTARGYMYNPSRAAQESFRESILQLLPRKYHPTILDDESLDDDDDESGSASSPAVLFHGHEFLRMSITFRMKRPKSHFVGNKPGPGRLKPTAPGKLHSTRSDVDNLAKFVMDSLNGLLYVDDRQVVSLNAMKVMDTVGDCSGATDVVLHVLEEEDV